MADIKQYNEVLASIRQRLSEDLQEKNVEETTDSLDAFMADNARHVSREVDLSEDEALDFVFAVAESLQSQGALEGLPALGESASEWIKDATSINFALQVVQEARLSKAQRAALPNSAFADPKDRKYPVTDKQHAIAAAGLAGMHNASAKVKAAIAKKDATKGVLVKR